MKALLIAIVLLTGADWALNHGNVSRRIVGGVAGFLGASGSEARSSVFAK